jgi:outer membrane protein assembly factor BamE (lipoprotein component of BamABCDE complex)
MNKIYFIIIFLCIANCSLNKAIKHHGVNFLEKKQEKLILKTTNKNDIVKILGPPSTKSTFENDVWIFIERKTTTKTIFKLAKEKILVNNVLVLEIDSYGLLVKKEFYNMEKMNDLDFSKRKTEIIYTKKSFVYDFMSSMRRKLNDPLGKRKK